MCRGHRRLSAPVTGSKSSLAVAATNVGHASNAPDLLNIRLANIRLNGRLLQFPHTAMEAAKPGSRSRSTKVFCGWSGPARSAPPVRPSAQPFSPPPRSTDGAHINPCGPSGCQQALHQCQTQGDAHEATRAGIARPAGGRAWAGNAPAPVSKLRAPGFHTTAQTPRPE